jgi:acetylornithine deacetylase/succinyl-diaminopimelate desuccinylase-like protein
MKLRYLAAPLLAAALACEAAPGEPHQQLLREIYAELVNINTTQSVGDTFRAAEAMAARLRAGGFPSDDVHALMPAPRKGNLVAHLHGTGARRPLLLLAHLDVVEALREDWSVDPFTLLERDGYFYGRGSADDKAMAAIFVANLIRYRQEGYRPERDIIVALTADEETSGKLGIVWLLEEHRDLVDAELAINEGGGGAYRRGRYLYNAIQASEKIYYDYRLEIHNPGGHSSLPVKDNAITRLSAALVRIGEFDFPVHLDEVNRHYFERMATLVEESEGPLAADLRAVAAGGRDPAVMTRLAASNANFNARLRTTCVATMIDGGHAANALPQTVRAVVNCRVLPGETEAGVRATLEKVIADPGITITPVDAEFLPSPASPLTPEVLGAVGAVTAELWPGLPVLPLMATGATDSRFLRNAGIPAYGTSGIFYDIDDNRAHGRDERIRVAALYEGQEYLYRLVKRLAGDAGNAAARAP